MELNVSSNSHNYNRSLNTNNNKPSFKGGPLDPVSVFMNLAQNNPAFSTGLTDVAGMVTPRTIIDSYRNKHASTETFRRESAGTVNNNIIPGFFAFGVALAVQPILGVKTTIWADSESMDLLKEAWDGAAGTGSEKTENYVNNVLKGLKGRDGEKWNDFTKDKWENLPADEKSKLPDPAKKLTELIENKNKLSRKDMKRELAQVQDSIGAVIKARESVTVSIKNKTLDTNLEYLVRDMRDMGEHVFNKYAKNEKNTTIDAAISKLKKNNVIKAAIPLAVLCTLDFATQYLNRKKTRKDTGVKGFVGYKDFGTNDCEVNDPEKKKKLNIKKIAGLGVLLGLNLVFIGHKNLGKKLEFKGIFPNLDQIKLLYSTTVAGRIVAADDDNELRETCTRDYFSYMNWLILGNFVTKGIVWKNDKGLFNFGKCKDKPVTLESIKNEKNPLEKFWMWSHGTSIKTHNEILDLSRSKVIKTSAEKEKKLKLLNRAIGAGLVYSTVMLGIGVPILNILLTNKKRDEELAAKKLTENAAYTRNASILANDRSKQLFSAFQVNKKLESVR